MNLRNNIMRFAGEPKEIGASEVKSALQKTGKITSVNMPHAAVVSGLFRRRESRDFAAQ
jgi:hypothetical protein